MEVILNIKDKTKAPFLMELLGGLDYVSVVKKVKQKRKNRIASDLKKALKEVKLHQEGKIKLQTVDEFLDGL